MKILLSLVTLVSVSSAHASVLADCKGKGVSITITSGRNGNQATLELNGTQSVVSRKMQDGVVTYKTTSLTLQVIGNHRQMGNPLGYLSQGTKKSVVVCSSGVDIEKIADDTDLF